MHQNQCNDFHCLFPCVVSTPVSTPCSTPARHRGSAKPARARAWRKGEDMRGICLSAPVIIDIVLLQQRKRKTVRPRKAVILDSDNEEDMVSKKYCYNINSNGCTCYIVINFCFFSVQGTPDYAASPASSYTSSQVPSPASISSSRKGSRQ